MRRTQQQQQGTRSQEGAEGVWAEQKSQGHSQFVNEEEEEEEEEAA